MKEKFYPLAVKEKNFLEYLLKLFEKPEEYRLGINYITSGNIEQAISEFKSLKKDFPVCFNLGLTYWLNKDYVKASSSFYEACARSSGKDKTRVIFFYFQSLFYLSIWYFNKRDFSRLEDVLAQLSLISLSSWKYSHDDFSLYKLMKSLLCLVEGIIYLKKNDVSKGLKHFRISLKWNKNSPVTFYYLAMTEGQLKNFHKASYYTERGLKISPGSSYLTSLKTLISRYRKEEDKKNPFLSVSAPDLLTIRNFSWLLLTEGSPGMALTYLEKGISLCNVSSSLFLYKGLALEYVNQFEEALSAYQKAFEFSDTGFYGDMLLGRAFYKYSLYAKAKEFFEKALKKEENSVSILLYLSEISVKEGNYSEAITYLEKLTEIKGSHVIPSLVYLMNCFYLKEEYSKALDISFKIFREDKEQFYKPGIRFFRSLIYLDMNKIDNALLEVNDSLRYDQQNPVALSYKGFIMTLKTSGHKFLKNFREPLSLFSRSLKIDFQCPVVYLHLYCLYYLTGDRKKKDWALSNLCRMEIEERDIKIFKKFFPDMAGDITDRLKIKDPVKYGLISSLSEEQFIDNFTPFKMFAISCEEEILLFSHIYKTLLTRTYRYPLFLLSGTLYGQKEFSLFHIKTCMEFMGDNPVMIDIINDFYIKTKDRSPEAFENYRLTFSLNPEKENNTIFLAKLLREQEDLSVSSLPVYEKCWFLRQEDKENLLALVKTLLIHGKTMDSLFDMCLQIYLSGKNFAERDRLLSFMAEKFLSEKNNSYIAQRIYIDSLKSAISEQLKDSIMDFLTDIFLEERRLDELALGLYLNRYSLYPDSKEIILICTSALVVNKISDEFTGEIYRKSWEINRNDRASFIMWVYINFCAGVLQEQKYYLEKALSIILSDTDRYTGHFWHDISIKIIHSIALIYLSEERTDRIALETYKRAIKIKPEHEKLKYYLLMSALENKWHDIEAIEIYRYFFNRNDVLIKIREKIVNTMLDIYASTIIPCALCDEFAYEIYSKAFSRPGWKPDDRDIRILWNYFTKHLSTLPDMAGGLIKYLSEPEIISLMEGKEFIPFRKGFVYLFMGHTDESIMYLEKDINKKTSPLILYCLAKLNLEIGHDGHKFIELIKVEDIPDVSTSLAVGRFYLAMGNKEKGTDLYRNALKKFPDKKKEFLRELGLLYMETSPEAAEEYFKELISMSPCEEEALVTLGNLAISRKSYEEAYNYFLSLQKVYPENSKALEGLAVVYYYTGKESDSLELLSLIHNKKVKLSPEGAFIFAQCLKRKGDYIKALECYSQAINEGYQNPGVYLERAFILKSLGRLKASAYDFGVFLKNHSDQDEDKIEVLINMAEIARELGEFSSALMNLKKAFKISIKTCSGRKNYILEELTSLCLKLKHFSPSELYILNKYLKIHHEESDIIHYRSDILYNLAIKEEEKGNREGAEKIYKKIIAYDNHIESFVRLGYISYERGDMISSVTWWEKAENNGSQDMDICRKLHTYYLNEHITDKAIKYLYKPVKAEWKRDELIILADLLIKKSSYNEAIKLLEEALMKGIIEDNIYYLLGKSYMELLPAHDGHFSKALQYLKNIKEETYDTVSLTGQVYIKSGNTDMAEQFFNKLPDNSPERYYNLGILYTHKGKLKDSQDCFELAIEISPGYKDLKAKLAMIYIERKSFNPAHINFLENILKERNDWPAEKLKTVMEHLHSHYTAHNEWKKGINLLEPMLKMPDLKTDERLWAWLALDFIHLNNMERASEILNKFSLKNNEKEGEILKIHRIFAEKLISDSDYGSARTIYEKIYKCDPEYSVAGKMLEMLSKERVGRFALIEPAGKGANASVWKAFDLISLRTVALKILHSEHRLNEEIKKEINREYNLLLDLNLPSVVSVIPESYGEYYFAMEYLDGSLTKILKENPGGLDMPDIMDIASQVAEILSLLHQNNIIYQDLAPDNIMFDRKSIKLCDFGGAKKLDAVGKTEFGGTVAHLAWASPEQCISISGGTASVDHRTDIYSFGILLYEMVTGELPFNLPDPQLISAHQYSAPVPPVMKRDNISKQLNDLIMKCLAKKPEERFQTIKEIWIILQQIPRF